MTEAAKAKSRLVALDAFRGIAICCVVLAHTTPYGWAFYGTEHDWNFWWSLHLRNILIPCLPIFLIISGYLMGNTRCNSRGEYISFLQKRVSRVAVPFLFWSCVFIGISAVRMQNYSIWDALLRLISGRADGPYYFILVILQLYILTPFIGRILDNKRGFAFLIAVNVIYNVAVYLVTLLQVVQMPYEEFSKTLFPAWIGVYALGMWARQRPQLADRYPLWLAIAVSIATCGYAMAESIWLVQIGQLELARTDIRPGMPVYGVAFFFVALKFLHRSWSAALVQLGTISFGIFFIHGFILRRVGGLLQAAAPELITLLPAFQIITTTVTLAICVAIILAARRILPERIYSRVLGFG